MPDLTITGVKENIARFENVIMKQTYSEAGEQSFTTAQVIDEETGNVICECEAGGGGGDSDFTTAEITFKLIEMSEETVNVTFFTCAEADELGEGAPATMYFGQLPVTEGYKAIVPLYKGCFACLTSLIASNDYNISGTTGNIEIANNMMMITGDGEILLTDK